MSGSSNKYEISVIIPTYNRSQLLQYTLDSLCLQQIEPWRFEVIVSDDGSSDHTRGMISRYEHMLNLKYVYQEDRGYRVASARNNAIRRSAGNVCLFIDAGVILHVDCVAEHIRFHRTKIYRKSAIGYVYGFDHHQKSNTLLKDLIVPSDPVYSIRQLEKSPQFRDVRDKHYRKYNYKIENLPAPWYYFWTCHVSVSTEDIVKIGLFDEAYDGRWGVEDNDLGIRLYQDDVQICLLRTALSIHYPHFKDQEQRKREGYRNLLYLHHKFNMLETKLCVENYDNGLVDLNEIILKLLQDIP
ncbi:glycosyltransferase [Fulvivirgaceae bacterium BMA12]|uniref:Glycosyltransferase n=1 Tax=Agaribacillus aureus TaxID=3051825 RepID=A0ABT8LB27_9BACT|nr:glycosyltransferase [Fulvivirgaceae bacterium BMA12]